MSTIDAVLVTCDCSGHPVIAEFVRHGESFGRSNSWDYSHEYLGWRPSLNEWGERMLENRPLLPRARAERAVKRAERDDVTGFRAVLELLPRETTVNIYPPCAPKDDDWLRCRFCGRGQRSTARTAWKVEAVVTRLAIHLDSVAERDLPKGCHVVDISPSVGHIPEEHQLEVLSSFLCGLVLVLPLKVLLRALSYQGSIGVQ